MTDFTSQWKRCFLLAAAMACTLVVLCACACGAYTEGDPEFRAFWVDAWHAGPLSQSQVDNLLGVPGETSTGQIRDANCNAVIVQVRRDADANYPSSMGEPYMSGLSPADFNALQAIIDAAHDTTGGKPRVEVHVWMVTFRTSGGMVYALHHDPPTGSLTSFDNYWPSRDNSGNETGDKAFDPGHPLCEEYLVNVAMDLVTNFDIDGIHYDYVRFTANNQGYNPTSVARYNTRYGLTGQPANVAGKHGDGDPSNQWDQWRRDQITALVRKVYAKIQSIKPWVKQSGSFVTWNPSPSSSTREAFKGTRPYYDVYCDWDSWLQEGILDAAVPMTYYDLMGAYPNDWAKWLNFDKDRHGDRHMYIGPGLYLNSLSSSITELLQTRDASPSGNYADGFSGYSYYAPFTHGGTNYGTWGEFFPDFTTQVATSPVSIPAMPWKVSPTKGHISGTVTVAGTGAWSDGATVTLTGPEERTMLTDGTGFYAFIDLTPGVYTVTASKALCNNDQKQVTVAVGSVTGNMYVTNLAIHAPPTITNVHITAIGPTSATVAWTTDQVSSSQAEYGLTTDYGSSTPVNPSLVTSHSVTMTGLNTNTLYHYQVVSANAVGSTSSADYMFTSGSFALALVPNPSVGGSCPGGGWYVGGTPITVTATPNNGYTFASWSTNPDGTGEVSTNNPYSFNMPNTSQTLYANFHEGVADIIIEAWANHGQGHNPDWYSDGGSGYFGDTSAKSSAPGLTPGIYARYSSITGDLSGRQAYYKPEIKVDGLYKVWVTWGTQPSGGSNIKHTVTYRDGQYTYTYNQAANGNKWNAIGTFAFAAGPSGSGADLTQWAAAAQSGKRIVADSAKWVYVGPFKAINPNPADGAIDVPASNPTLSWTAGGTTGGYDVYFGTNSAALDKVSSKQGGTSYSPDMLTSTTTYYWRADSISMGKVTTGDTWSFTTVAVPPIISNVVISAVTSSGATISWDTDQPSSSQVEYGPTTTYGQSTTQDTNQVTSHSVTLTGLSANTLYHLRAQSTNKMALTGYSADRTLATDPELLAFIVDNLQGVATGTWTALTDSGGWPTTASQYIYALNKQTTTTATFTWTPNITVAGKYNIYCWYNAGADRTTSARYTVAYASGQMLVSIVNQALTGSQWVLLVSGKQFSAGTTGYVQLTNKTGETDGARKVVADAIKFEYAENDVTPPSVPTGLIATARSTSQIDLAWHASTDDYALVGYKVFRDSQVVAITSSTSYSDTGLIGNTYHSYRVLAYDAANNESAQSSAAGRCTLSPAITTSTVTCDRTASVYYPTSPFKFTNLGFGAGKVTIYRYVWDNNMTHTWTNSEAMWAATQMTLNITTVRPWYFHVKGYNGDGVTSGTLDLGPYYFGVGVGSIPQAMNKPDGTVVYIQAFTPITAVLGSYFYVEETSRARGLRVEMTTAFPVGKRVKVAGTLATTNQERCLINPMISESADGSALRAMFMRTKELGGKSPNTYTIGFSNATGLYNVGLLVRIAGKVTSHTSGHFAISDGSGPSIVVYSSKAVSDGAYVGATGICCVENGACVLRTRTVGDVVVY